MKSRKHWLALGASFVLNGCCDKVVEVRVYSGSLSAADCAAAYLGESGVGSVKPEVPPYTLDCPGNPVTVCWLTPKGGEVDITVSPDQDGVLAHDAGVLLSSLGISIPGGSSDARVGAQAFVPLKNSHVAVK